MHCVPDTLAGLYERRSSANRAWTIALVLSTLGLLLGATPTPKPKVAVFPLGGDAKAELRDRCAFSLRSKLDRDGTYEVIDGPMMADLAGEADAPIRFDTPDAAVRQLASHADAAVLVWGEMTNSPAGATMRLNVLDLRQTDPKPRKIERLIAAPTDLRFIAEQVLESLPEIKKFEHPIDVPVWDDETARKLWQENPNLAVNGDFSQPGQWDAVFEAQKYPVQFSDELPAIDTVNIYRQREGGSSIVNNVLAMNLSRYCAENNGMACWSQLIPVAPDTRYRLSFRYQSDGPALQCFVKGYTLFDNIKGQKVPREIYRRQVPGKGATGGQWVTVVDDLNPQHVAFPVQYLKIDLYAFERPGIVMFDDVVLKAVGKQMRKATDAAIDKPTTRPRGGK